MSDSRKSHRTQPFLAFVSEEGSVVAAQKVAAKREWPAATVHQGDARAAAELLKSEPSPGVLLVEITSAEEAPAQLDALAAVVDPKVKVIVCGTVDEYSFYSWLMDIGIVAYLLEPFTVEKLDAAIDKAREGAGAATSEKRATVVSVMSARGGLGGSTVAANLAWLMGAPRQKEAALLDFDFHFGTAALALDIEASHGLREALEKPDRVDELFLDRVMARLDGLSVLAGEEPIDAPLKLTPATADALITKIVPTSDVVVIDLPTRLDAFTQQALSHSDHWLVVCDLSLVAIRDALRFKEAARKLGVVEPQFVLNKVGQVPKHEMPRAEFEKGLQVSVLQQLPFDPLCVAAAMEGKLVADMAPKGKFVTALKPMIAKLDGQVEEAAPVAKPGLFRKKGK